MHKTALGDLIPIKSHNIVQSSLLSPLPYPKDGMRKATILQTRKQTDSQWLWGVKQNLNSGAKTDYRVAHVKVNSNISLELILIVRIHTDTPEEIPSLHTSSKFSLNTCMHTLAQKNRINTLCSAPQRRTDGFVIHIHSFSEHTAFH